MMLFLVKLQEAGSAEEGLCRIDAFAPQMIFIDIYTPDINGLDLANKIRPFHSEIIMAIFARYDSPKYQEVANDSKVKHLIPKDDWTSKDILQMVETILPQLPV